MSQGKLEKSADATVVRSINYFNFYFAKFNPFFFRENDRTVNSSKWFGIVSRDCLGKKAIAFGMCINTQFHVTVYYKS